jgi:hypothetical protein
LFITDIKWPNTLVNATYKDYPARMMHLRHPRHPADALSSGRSILAFPPVILLFFIVFFDLSFPSNLVGQVDQTVNPSSDQPAPIPILSIDQVRIGMKGYGLSVFHGITIEPFEVEVISVMRDFGPERGVIWIRCPDERMQMSGPVAGMSGSPVYLWQEGEPHTLGQGGRLIGAAAFGFGSSKDCYFGVQPIELMIQAADRAPTSHDSNSASSIDPAGAAWPSVAIDRLLKVGSNKGLSDQQTWRSRAIRRLVTPLNPEKFRDTPHSDQEPLPCPEFPFSTPSTIRPMMLPMAVSSPELQEVLSPLLEPLGLVPIFAPVNGGNHATFSAGSSSTLPPTLVGRPPTGIDPQTIRIEPGSVLSVPLAFGSLDLSAIGTVTTVLPDGRVLGFGHAMFGQGHAALPMASGYVHMIIPSYVSSFKLGGSGVLHGAIVNDEKSAVIGTPDGKFDSSPVDVTINYPGQPQARYHYQVVHHEQLTPIIAAIVTIQSLSALTNLPDDNTVRVRGSFRFTGGRTLEMNSLLTSANTLVISAELLPQLFAMIQNPHEKMMLEKMDVTIDVETTPRFGSIVSAQLDRAELAPGDTVSVTLQIHPYAKPVVKKRVEFKLPQSLRDGEYNISICDAQNYARLLFESHPHLLTNNNADDLTQALQRILDITNDSLYFVLELPNRGLAVGREELPMLPSSRRALIETLTSTLPTPYAESVEQKTATDLVLQGNMQFTITVRKSLADK